MALTNSLDLNGCGLGVEDPYLSPAVCTNVAVGTIHKSTLQEEGRERENLKKRGHRKVQQKTLQAQNSGHLGCTRGECSRRNILFSACNCAAAGAQRNGTRAACSESKNPDVSIGMDDISPQKKLPKGSMKPLVSAVLLAKAVTPSKCGYSSKKKKPRKCELKEATALRHPTGMPSEDSLVPSSATTHQP